jgi:hypothetical protein
MLLIPVEARVIFPYLMMLTPIFVWVVVIAAVATSMVAAIEQAEENRAVAHGYDRRKAGGRRRTDQEFRSDMSRRAAVGGR